MLTWVTVCETGREEAGLVKKTARRRLGRPKGAQAEMARLSEPPRTQSLGTSKTAGWVVLGSRGHPAGAGNGTGCADCTQLDSTSFFQEHLDGVSFLVHHHPQSLRSPAPLIPCACCSTSIVSTDFQSQFLYEMFTVQLFAELSGGKKCYRNLINGRDSK